MRLTITQFWGLTCRDGIRSFDINITHEKDFETATSFDYPSFSLIWPSKSSKQADSVTLKSGHFFGLFYKQGVQRDVGPI